MSAKLKYAFLCDGAMVVQGKWTFQGLFSVINAYVFPVLHPQMILAMEFAGPAGAQVLRIHYLDSCGKMLGPEVKHLVECPEFTDATVIVSFSPTPIPSAGFYHFKVWMNQDPEPFADVEFRAVKVPGLQVHPEDSNYRA